jgi:hypothetical protein
MEVRGVQERVNTSQAYVWEDAVQYATFPLAQNYTNSQVGDFVRFNDNAELERSPSASQLVNYRGVVVGIAPNSGEYPAFGAHFGQPLIALLSPNKTELIMRQIDNNGNYLQNPTLRAGQTTAFVYNNSTRRWGVQPNGSNPATGRVVQVLSDGRLLILFGA